MPTAPTSSTGSLNITVGFDSGNITVKNGSTDVSTGFTLSRNGTATATLTSEGSYTSVTWYVDGTAQSGNTLNLDAASLNIRTHSVTFTGTRDGLLYSSRPISVVVTN
jgi:hypothetical protein